MPILFATTCKRKSQQSCREVTQVKSKHLERLQHETPYFKMSVQQELTQPLVSNLTMTLPWTDVDIYFQVMIYTSTSEQKAKIFLPKRVVDQCKLQYPTFLFSHLFVKYDRQFKDILFSNAQEQTVLKPKRRHMFEALPLKL